MTDNQTNELRENPKATSCGAEAAQTAQGCVDDQIVYGFQFCDKPDSTMLGETVFDSVGEPVGWIVANGLKGDCGHDADMSDSREKLEADILAWRGKPASIVDMIPVWLDRQAAITQNETIHDYNIAARESGRILRDEIAELQADRDELQRQLGTMRDVTREFRDERDEWKAKAKKLDYEVRDWKGEAKTQRNNFYQATEARKYWQRKYENLKATSYSAEAPSDKSELARELGKALGERDMYRDKLDKDRDKLGKALAERDAYRDKLGRAIDAAHEIVRIMEVER